jgi:hypothetical protein
MRLTARGEFVAINLLALTLLATVQFVSKEPSAIAEEISVKQEVVAEIVWTPEHSKDYARKIVSDYGWNQNQFLCLEQLWNKESNWRHKALNKTPIKVGDEIVYAGGIPQILGLDPETPAQRQIERGLDYVQHRYDNPCNAWTFWQRQAGKDMVGGWY